MLCHSACEGENKEITKRREVIVGTHYCTIMTLNYTGARIMQGAVLTSSNISATVTCMMSSEEHLCSVSLLQRVHLSNLVMELEGSSLYLILYHLDQFTSLQTISLRSMIIISHSFAGFL
jgi:hypothetical protein